MALVLAKYSRLGVQKVPFANTRLRCLRVIYTTSKSALGEPTRGASYRIAFIGRRSDMG